MRASAIPPQERVLAVRKLAGRLRYLVAEGLEVERVLSLDRRRFACGEVVEEARADDAKAAVERGKVFAERKPGRSMVELVGIEPKPPDVVETARIRDLVDRLLHESDTSTLVVGAAREASGERRAGSGRPLDGLIRAVVVDEVDTVAALREAVGDSCGDDVLLHPGAENGEQRHIGEWLPVGRIVLCPDPGGPVAGGRRLVRGYGVRATSEPGSRRQRKIVECRATSERGSTRCGKPQISSASTRIRNRSGRTSKVRRKAVWGSRGNG